MNKAYAREFGKQKWTPEVMVGSNDSGVSGGSQMDQFISLLTTKAAKDLSLNLSVPATK